MSSKEIIVVSQADLAKEEIIKILGGDLPKKSDFLPYRPRLEWYANQEIGMGKHGIGHETRVLILQEVIARLVSKQTHTYIDPEPLRWAAVMHDTQRIDNFEDENHGQRASDWLTLLAQTDEFRPVFSRKLLSATKGLIKGHVPADKIGMSISLQDLKDADALDRVRLEYEDNLHCKLDPSYLRLDVSKELMVPLAEELFFISQLKEHLSRDPFSSAIDSAIQIGIVSRA